MTPSVYIKSQVNRFPPLVSTALILILFTAIAQFASFGAIQAHVTSFYGAQPEDISFALQITYAGIITTLPVQFRLLRYFNTQTYLLTALLAGILLNIGCLLANDLMLFCVLRFMTGIVTTVIAGCILIVIFSTLPDSKKMLVGISLFFSLILTCGLLVGIGASWIVEKTNWTALYYGLIGLQVMAILLCLFVFKSGNSIKPYPLYQVDWAGSLLFMFAAVAASFVMIYGSKKYWFADPGIRNAAIFSAVMLILFLIRQLTLKRPLIDLNVFKSGRFIFALLLLLLFYGMRDSINLIYGYSAAILNWSSSDVASSGLFSVAGIITATLIVVKMILVKKQALPLLLLAGFAVMLFYHLWMYKYLTPDLSIKDLAIPIFLQGFGSGLLFVPITIFCTAGLPKSTGMTGIVICSYARFIAVHCSIAGFYTMQLNYNQQFKESFLGKLAPDSQTFIQRQDLYKNLLVAKGYSPGQATGISNMLIAKSTAMQSQLLTIRAIFWIAAVLMAIAFMSVLVFIIIQKTKAQYAKRSAMEAVLTNQ